MKLIRTLLCFCLIAFVFSCGETQTNSVSEDWGEHLCDYDERQVDEGFGLTSRGTRSISLWIDHATVGPLFYPIWGANWQQVMVNHFRYYWTSHLDAEVNLVSNLYDSTLYITARASPTCNCHAYYAGSVIVFNTSLPSFNWARTFHHEVGHSWGLGHTNGGGSVMSIYDRSTTLPGFRDISVAQGNYGTKKADSYDQSADNGDFGSATEIKSKRAGYYTFMFGSMHSTSDADVYKVSIGDARAKEFKVGMNITGTSPRNFGMAVYQSDKKSAYDSAGTSHDTKFVPNAKTLKDGFFYIKVYPGETGRYTLHTKGV